MSKRVFTDEELKAMSGRTLDLVDAAIDSGDKEAAKKLNHRMYAEFLMMHDLYLNWVTGLLSHIYQRYGDDGLNQSLRESCTVWWKPFIDQYLNSPVRKRAELFAGGLRGHLQPIKIEEDDDKIIVSMIPCGSGGRLVISDSYSPPKALAKVKKAQAMTYGRADFPVYCTHCAIMEMLSVEWAGAPLITIIPPKKIGEEPCRLCVLKDPQRFQSSLVPPKK